MSAHHHRDQVIADWTSAERARYQLVPAGAGQATLIRIIGSGIATKVITLTDVEALEWVTRDDLTRTAMAERRLAQP